MKHLIMAATMLLGALAITFGAASVLQDVATAREKKSAEPFVVDASGLAIAPFGIKEHTGEARERSRAGDRLASW